MKLDMFIKVYKPSKKDIETIKDLIKFKNNYKKKC